MKKSLVFVVTILVTSGAFAWLFAISKANQYTSVRKYSAPKNIAPDNIHASTGVFR